MFRLSRRNVLSTTLSLIACSMALLLTVTNHTVAHAAPLVQANGQNLQLVDRLGLSPEHIAIKGNYAYVTTAASLVVLDVSNPASPVHLNTIPSAERAFDLVIADDMLYVVGFGIHAYSISDPFYPVEVSTIYSTLYASGLVAQGKYLYVPGMFNDDFTIWDVTKPASPTQVASYTYPEGTANSLSSLAVQGNYLYLLSPRASGLLIIDISDPSKPQLVSRLEITYKSDGKYSPQALVAVVGETVYLSYVNSLADSRIEELALIDVSDPSAPKQKGKITIPSDGHLLRDIEVSGNYVYWGGFGDPQRDSSPDIKIVNTTDPEHPVLEQSLAFDSVSFAIADNRLYNVSHQHGLQIFDLSPSLTWIGSYNPGHSSFGQILIQDKFLYSTGDGELQVADLAKPSMSVIASLAIDGRLFALEDNKAYLSWSTSSNELGTCSGFHIVDVTNPFSPTLTLTYQTFCSQVSTLPSLVNFQTVAIGHLYATDLLEELYALDLTTLMTSTLLASNVGTIFIKENYAYVGLTSNRVAIYRITDDASFTLVSSFSTEERVVRLTAYGHYLFGQINFNGTYTTYIWDIANPTAPVEEGNIPNMVNQNFAIEGDYFYLLGPNYSVLVFDIVDPTHPFEVARYPDIWGFYRLQGAAASDHKLYLAFSWGELLNLQLSGTISGKVVDSFGKAHAGVKVILSSGQSTETSTQGDYSFTSLIPGSYTVKAESPTYDFQPAEHTLRVPSYSSDSVNFTLLLKPLSAAVTPDAPTHLSYTDLGGNVLEFDLPVGVVARPTPLSVLPQAFAAAPGQFFTGVRFDLQTSEVSSASSNFTFTAPLTITIHYTDSTVAPVTDRNQLLLRWWDGSQWTDATTTCASATPALHDLGSQVLTTTVCQSGQFALFGPTLQQFLPLVSRSQVETSAEMRGRFVAQHSGKCLNVLAESQQNGASIIQWPCVGGDNEIWTVRSQGEYVQLTAKHSQKCLRVESQVEGAPVIQWSCTGADAELWRLVPTDPTVASGNTFWLVDKRSGLCLTVQDASQEDKAQVVQRGCNESQNQSWRFETIN